MSKHLDSLLIVEDRNGRTAVDRCTGPDELGNCPKVAFGDIVPCAGHALQAKARNGSDPWRLIVAKESVTCPLPPLQQVRRPVGVFAALLVTAGLVVGAAAATFVTITVKGSGTSATPTTQAPAAPSAAKVSQEPAAAGASAGGALFTADQVPVTLSDFKVAVPATAVTAGTKTLQITNSGSMPHELLVFHPDASIDPTKLPVDAQGDIVEDASGVNKVSDGDNIDPGKSQTRQLDLTQPGTYIFVCNLPGHYKLGMWVKVDVVAASFAANSTLRDFRVDVPTTLSPGIYTFTIANAGSMPHELLVFHPDASIDPTKLPLDSEGNVVEDAPGINKISDGDNIDPGKTQSRQVDLSQPGTYVFVCNLSGHYKLGMATVVTVK